MRKCSAIAFLNYSVSDEVFLFFYCVWFHQKHLFSFLKSAITALEFMAVKIALCKSPFNVTFFSFHETGMSHQKGRLKFHYQGGFGHELKSESMATHSQKESQNN